mgnify:CR=1 FL=1
MQGLAFKVLSEFDNYPCMPTSGLPFLVAACKLGFKFDLEAEGFARAGICFDWRVGDDGEHGGNFLDLHRGTSLAQRGIW